MAVIDARDIAAVAALVLGDPPAPARRSDRLTGAENLTDTQMVAMIAAAIGREVKDVDAPEHTATDAIRQMAFPPKVNEWLMSLNYAIKQGWAAGVSPAMQQITGHAPRTVASCMREHVAAWR